MTENKRIYLKPNVVFEPLVNQWYAWTFLIQPATYAMVLKNSHLRIMESFIKAPELHRRSAEKMAGGPFLNAGKEMVPDIERLIDSSKQQCAGLLELADAMRSLDELLAAHGEGDSLAALYEQVPDNLKGLVELGYDLHGQPSFRFFERLLFRSEFYRPQLQSVNGFLAETDNRSFMLSTPRVAKENMVQIRLPFNHPLYDRLFASRFVGTAPELIDELLQYVDGGTEKTAQIANWFAEQAVPCTNTGVSDGLRVRYFSHATVLLETPQFSLMTDPIVGYALGQDGDPFTFADLPERLDYVVLTHNHQDHIVLESLLQIRHRIGTIIVPRSHAGFLQDPSIKLTLQACGFERVIEVGEMESVPVPGGEIIAIPFLGEHGDLHIAAKTAFAVKVAQKSLLFAADSNNLQPEMYRRIAAVVGNIDTIFLGMECEGAPMSWLYGALLHKQLSRKFDQNRRLNGSDCERAWNLVRDLSPQRVYVYAMGAEPWVNFISSIQYTAQSLPIVESDKLLVRCREHGIYAERLYLKKEISL